MTNRTDGAATRSVQTRANSGDKALQYGPEAWAYFNLFQRQRNIWDVSPYGYADRDQNLRRLWTLSGGEVVAAAISSHVQKLITTGFFLEGNKALAKRMHSVFTNADFGQGWEEFLSRCAVDYLTQDNGLFIEVIGAGSPDGPLVGEVLGLAHLDSARCIRTGDIDYPVTYFGLTNGYHRLHYTRVMYAADLPSPNENRRGVGFCALSRCISAVQALILFSEFRNEALDDMPPLGILAVNGMNYEGWKQQYKSFESERAAKGQDVYRGLIALFGSGLNKIDVTFTPFRQLWDGFEDKRFVDIMIDLIAMAFNMDRQELAQLSGGGMMGSGAQSKTLAKHGRGKGLHNLINLFERMLNRVTPEAITFRFDFHDQDEELQKWQIIQMKANVITSLYTATSPQSSQQVDGMGMNKPTTTTTQPGLLSLEEARYMLIKEGVMPRELMQPDENLAPDWQRFDDVTVKALRRFGPRVQMDRLGNTRLIDRRLIPFPTLPMGSESREVTPGRTTPSGLPKEAKLA